MLVIVLKTKEIGGGVPALVRGETRDLSGLPSRLVRRLIDQRYARHATLGEVARYLLETNDPRIRRSRGRPRKVVEEPSAVA